VCDQEKGGLGAIPSTKKEEKSYRWKDRTRGEETRVNRSQKNNLGVACQKKKRMAENGNSGVQPMGGKRKKNQKLGEGRKQPKPAKGGGGRNQLSRTQKGYLEKRKSSILYGDGVGRTQGHRKKLRGERAERDGGRTDQEPAQSGPTGLITPTPQLANCVKKKT